MTTLTLIRGGKAAMEDDSLFAGHVHDGSVDGTCPCHALIDTWIRELHADRGKEYTSYFLAYARSIWPYPRIFSYAMRFIQEWETQAEQPLLAFYVFWMLHNFTDEYCRTEEGIPGDWIEQFSYRDVWPDLSGNQRRKWLNQQKRDFRGVITALNERDELFYYQEWQETAAGTANWKTSLPKDRLLLRQMHAFMRSLLLCREKRFQASLLVQQRVTRLKIV